MNGLRAWPREPSFVRTHLTLPYILVYHFLFDVTTLSSTVCTYIYLALVFILAGSVVILDESLAFKGTVSSEFLDVFWFQK